MHIFLNPFSNILSNIGRKYGYQSGSCLGTYLFTRILCKSLFISKDVHYFDDLAKCFNNIFKGAWSRVWSSSSFLFLYYLQCFRKTFLMQYADPKKKKKAFKIKAMICQHTNEGWILARYKRKSNWKLDPSPKASNKDMISYQSYQVSNLKKNYMVSWPIYHKCFEFVALIALLSFSSRIF